GCSNRPKLQLHIPLHSHNHYNIERVIFSTRNSAPCMKSPAHRLAQSSREIRQSGHPSCAIHAIARSASNSSSDINARPLARSPLLSCDCEPELRTTLPSSCDLNPSGCWSACVLRSHRTHFPYTHE